MGRRRGKKSSWDSGEGGGRQIRGRKREGGSRERGTGGWK